MQYLCLLPVEFHKMTCTFFFDYFDYFSVSACAANPCLNDGSCSVDVNFEATCACSGEWSGYYCSGKFIYNF